MEPYNKVMTCLNLTQEAYNKMYERYLQSDEYRKNTGWRKQSQTERNNLYKPFDKDIKDALKDVMRNVKVSKPYDYLTWDKETRPYP